MKSESESERGKTTDGLELEINRLNALCCLPVTALSQFQCADVRSVHVHVHVAETKYPAQTGAKIYYNYQIR